MRVWLYARLSNDDDREMNSLQNQQEICREFALRRGDSIVGLSSDDNVSGMSFSRRGLSELTAAVDAGRLDAVIVKDLSRLGRHRTQTALLIDYLREHNVRVLSATENIDTFRDEDDLVIGVRGLMNDYYAKDIGRKIRAGYLQKQKEGLVITPPFGYWKDKNTGKIQVSDEAAETVRTIFFLYLCGAGLKEIARQLNEQGRKTPAQLRNERCSNAAVRRHVWTYTSVKNVLSDESYTGVLINRRRQMHEGKSSAVPKPEQLRHEGFYPAIIEREVWCQAQGLLKKKSESYPAGSNKATHRYAGLLICKECGSPFVPMNRVWNGACRVEYVCKGYHRSGKTYCASHRVHEETLDAQVREYAKALQENYADELKHIIQLQKMWALRKPILNARISALQEKIQTLDADIEALIMERIQDKANVARYDALITKLSAEHTMI